MKKRNNNYQPPRNLPPQIPNESSSSVQSKTVEEEEGFWLVEFVKFLFYGPEKSTKPLTFGVCLRRFFIVLDNLIAAVLVFYVLTWIKFYSNGADTSFDVIINDMTILCAKNIMGFFLIMIIATWRWFCYSDSLPCLKNFTYLRPYVICVGLIAIFSFCYFMYWLRLLMCHRFDIDSLSQPVGDAKWYAESVLDYMPYWAQEIRIVILGFVFMIRRLMLKDKEYKIYK